MLSIVQGLTHYSQFVSAAVLRELEVDLKRTMQFSSPNYSLFLSLLSRVVLQNPELYCQIQTENPYNGEVRKAFTKNSKMLEAICAKNGYRELQKEIILDAQSFKDPEAMLLESDRAVSAMKHVVNTLRANIGGKFLVENMVGNTFHYGSLVDANSKEITLREGSRETKIATPKIRITTKKEMKDWKSANLERRHLDFSFIVPEECDNEIIRHVLAHIKGVDFEVVDEYRGKGIPEGTKSLTYRASFFEDDDKEKIAAHVVEIIDGLGFKIR
jgi:ferredoxin-fold anticodon binding domain-containing protein